MTYVLGVDAGNSKTVALVADAAGRVRGWGRGGGGDLYVSEQAAVTAVAAAVERALVAAGVQAQDLHAACLSLVGADWPEDFAFWQREAEARGYGRSVTVVNDALGALRAGTAGAGAVGVVTNGDGVAVVCGTGAAVGARCGDRVWHSSFWQEPVGGFELGERALRAVYRAELGLGPPTRLTEQIMRHFGSTNVETVLHRLTGRETRALRQTAGLSRLLLDAAALGDAAALREVERAAAILSEYAWVAACRVGLEREPFTLVLAGGVLRHESPLLRDAIAAKVQEKLPLAVPRLAPFEPVVSALLLALESAALPLTDYAPLSASLPAPEFFAT